MVVPTIRPRPTCPTNLEAPLEALLVVAEYLDVVVQAADQPQPHRRYEHQLHVDVVEAPEQQDGHQEWPAG